MPLFARKTGIDYENHCQKADEQSKIPPYLESLGNEMF